MNTSPIPAVTAQIVEIDLATCSAGDLAATFQRARAAVDAARKASVQTLAVLAFRAALNGRR